MADLPPHPGSSGDTHLRSDRGSPPTTPGWVKVFVVMFVVLVVLFVILHLTGNGFSGLHGYTLPSGAVAGVREHSAQQPCL